MPQDQFTDVPDTFDSIATDLQSLRGAAGNPSYAEIVRLIAREREAHGVRAHVARPGRTTVYDAFRIGRRRVDPTLVGEIVRALGADAEEADRWEARCRDAVPAVARPEPAPLLAGPDPVEPVESVEPIEPVDPTDPVEAADTSEPASRRRWPMVLAMLLGCLAINLLGRVVVDSLDLPLYLDMAGTAVAAVVLGPWWGALAGAATNVAGVASSGPASLPFALVNVVGALVWGYGVRRFAMGATVPRFFVLNVLVALACTAVAAPIIVLVYHGDVGGNGSGEVVTTFREIYRNLVVAVLSANLLTSLADKLISGFVALTLAETVRGTSRPALSG